MVSPGDEFAHFHGDGLRDIELIRLKHDQEPNAATNLEAHTLLRTEFSDLLARISERLAQPAPTPENLLPAYLESLQEIEHFRFLLDNLLEAVKRDDSLQNALRRYDELGLLDFKAGQLAEEQRNSPWPFNPGSGQLLASLNKKLRKVALKLMELVVHAIKAIPRFVALKPRPAIGMAGPFPTLTIEFELEAESVSIHELLRALAGKEKD